MEIKERHKQETVNEIKLLKGSQREVERDEKVTIGKPGIMQMQKQTAKQIDRKKVEAILCRDK